MKLTKFNELWSSVRLFNVGLIEKTETILMSNQGIDTNLDDVVASKDGELITVLKDGTVRKTIAYISERPKYYDERNWGYPKYHIYDCQQMKKMRAENRAHRYKKTIRDDGSFYMIINYENGSSEEIYKKLNLCTHCFKEYKKNTKDGLLQKNFNLKEYLEKPIDNITPFLEINYDYTTVPKTYTQSWKHISMTLKKQRNYTCEECGIKLEGNYLKYLHCHHIDGDPSRNIISNLKVVCVECHSNEFSHNHIKHSKDYKDFIKIRKGI